MADKRFGENIQKYRNAKGLTQQELADMLELKNKSTLGSWEVGKSEPDAKMIAKLCKAFSIDANTLFDWNNDMSNNLEFNLKNRYFGIRKFDGAYVENVPQEDVDKIINGLSKLKKEDINALSLFMQFLIYKNQNKE